MFKKTWKQIKILLAIIIVLICLPHSIMPIRSEPGGKEEIESYKKQNELEKRLIEFRDDDEALKVKLAQLEIINKSRRKYNAPALKLDILASRVANKMSREAAENNYLGHWNMNGEEPYLRYAFAGGYDHVSENAYGEWSNTDFSVSEQTIGDMMRSGHGKFMAEKAPYDGHKQTIIDKSHNFAGIGYYLNGKQFRYYEEFIDRYLEFENIPHELKTGESARLTVKTNGRSFLYFMMIYREDFPQPMTPDQISKMGSYPDFTKEEYKNLVPWELSRYRNGTIYEIPVSFTKTGLYYIQLFSDKNEITKPSSVNTKGKTPESGIVIKVTN